MARAMSAGEYVRKALTTHVVSVDRTFRTYRNKQDHPRSQKSKKIAGNVTGRRSAYHIEK